MLTLTVMIRKSSIFAFTISLIIAVCLSGIVLAATGTFSVKTGEDKSLSIDLLTNDHVVIKFSVAWSEEASTVGFSIVCPNGTKIDFGEQGSFSFNLVCTEGGQYALHFVNQGLSTKIVTLEYTIEHQFLGISTNLFWLVIIALICIIGAIGYVILTRPS